MDQLEIINLALAKCGLPLAAALNDCDWNASYFFEAAKKELLRSYCWGFAQKFENLGPAGTPGCGFTKSYSLPDDFLRVVDVHCAHDLRSPKARSVRVVGKKIYTNVTPCYLRYISSESDCEDWPPDFCNAVASKLAMEIAPLSMQTNGMAGQLAQLYQLALAEAQATDARENFERVPLDYNILASRAGAGEHRGKIMGMDPVTFGLAMGGLSLASSVLGGAASDAQANAQGRQRAQQARAQAQAAKIQGTLDARKIDSEKIRLRREYNNTQAHNNVALGAGNVDGSRGSALRVAEGNLENFMSDLTENAHARNLRDWQTQEQVSQLNAQADYYSRTQNNMGSHILGGIIKAVPSFISSYSMAGGKLFGEAAKGSGKYWDRALGQWMDQPVRH